MDDEWTDRDEAAWEARQEYAADLHEEREQRRRARWTATIDDPYPDWDDDTEAA
jgi:hypothetical protein